MTRLPSYTSGGYGAPLAGDTVGDRFDAIVSRFGHREALVDVAGGVRLTYAGLAAQVDALALGLLDTGIATGDRIGIWAPNCAEWTVTQFAAAKIGAILVNINPLYREHELEYVLNQAGVRLLVAAPRYKASDYVAMIDQVLPRCPALEHVVYLGGASWHELIAAGQRSELDILRGVQATLSADDPINIQYTSGTTGFPKGATLSHHNIVNNGFFVGELCGYTEADRVCLPVPLFHCFGMVMGTLAAMTHGAAVVLPAPSFDAGATVHAVADERCTSLYGVPTMFIDVLAHPDVDGVDVSSLRTGIMSGSPCPVEVMKQVIDKLGMAEVTICYGMTETSPVATQTRAHDGMARRVSTVGAAGPHVEIKIVDPVTGRTVERGSPGEVCIRGYSVMLGYWEMPEKTAQVIDAARWMHTGDQGVLDDDGYLRITGRIKDMIVRGGENVYPAEIEQYLHTHPDIADAQVVGVPDDRYGEELVAWIRPAEHAGALTADEVREFCRGQLAAFKVPRYVLFTDEYPMTASGKVRKVELAEWARDQLVVTS